MIRSTLNAVLLFSAVLTFQAESFAQDQQPTEAEVVVKKKFSKLRSKEKKSMMTALRLIEKGTIDEDENVNQAKEAVLMLSEIGEGVIPKCLTSFPRMIGADRLEYLQAALNNILVDDDLALALGLSTRKTPNEVYSYLMSRWADSSREDTEEILIKHLANENTEIKYQCVRGLLRIGNELAIEPCIEIVDTQWVSNKQMIRKDFSGVSRGIMSDLIHKKISTPNKKARLLGLHLFELFGEKKHASLLVDNLQNSDTALRLGAINACRVVVDGDKPLLRPSMTELIEMGNAWIAKL